MKLRLSKISNAPVIMELIKDAQNYLAELSINQWQDGYPNKEQIELDIKNKDSYVVVNELNQIMITTVFTTKKENTYHNIKGEWLTENDAKYGVIHRLAVGSQFRKLGLAKFVFNKSEEKLRALNINSMRIDTHRENEGMQHLLKTLGYTYCGLIYLDNGDERLAYEKCIKQ